MPTTKHTIIVDAKIDGFKTKFEQLTSKLDEFSKKEYGAAFDAKKLNTFQTQAKGVIEKLKDFRTKTDESVGATLRRTGQQIAAGVQQVGGAVAGAAGGGGAGGMAGLAGLAAKLGAAGAVAGIPLALYGAASMAGAPRRGIAGQNLQIMGLGGPRSLGGLEGLRQQGMGYGYGARETLQQQTTGMRAMGRGFQARPFQRMARMMGLSPEELIGVGGGLRQAGIGAGQIPRAIEDMYTRAVAHGFDQSRAFDYMRAVSEHTAQLATTGGVSFKSITGIMEGFMKGSPFFRQNAQRGLTAMAGISQAMTGQGPIASVAIRALSGLMPNASVRDLLYAQQFGLEELSTRARRSRGMPSAGRQMTAFMNTVSQMVTGRGIHELRGDENSIRMLVPVMRQQFGFRASMAEEIVRAMSKGGTYDIGKVNKLISEEQKRANVQLADIQASMDMSTEVQKAKLTELTMDIGDVLVPLVQSINDAIWKVVDWFATLIPGAKLTPEEQARRMRAVEAPLESYRSRIEKGFELSSYEQKEYLGFAEKRRQGLLEQRTELLKPTLPSLESFGGEAFSMANLPKTPAELKENAIVIANINAELAKLAEQTKILTDSMQKHTDAVDKSTGAQDEYTGSIDEVKRITTGTRKLKHNNAPDVEILNIDSH